MSGQGALPVVGFLFPNDGNDWHGGLNYFRSLFLALQALEQPRVQPVAFVGKGSDVARLGLPSSVRVVSEGALDLGSRWNLLDRAANRWLGGPWLTNRALRRERVAVLSHSGAGRGAGCPAIGWIPDFQHLHLPQLFQPHDLALRDALYRDLATNCTRLVVSSESALRDLRAFAPDAARRAHVLRFVAQRPVIDAADGPAVRAAHGLDGPFFYLPNQAWVHKNHLVAIRALAELSARHPQLRIVCSGSLSDYRHPGHADALRAEIARLGLADRFLMLGLIPYAHIAQLMLQSVAVINPSLFEGWSTTVEEAKALGVPMILSAIDVHCEQCPSGEASFFEPDDPGQLAQRLEAALAAWHAGDGARDPAASLARHHERMLAFGRAYEDIVCELAHKPEASPPAPAGAR